MSEFDVSAVDLSGILNKNNEDKAKQLPDPSTYYMLTVVPEAMEEYSDSEVGLIKDSKTMYYEEVLTPVLFVVKMGPDCYTDTTRFPSGASCKVGDFVVVRPNSGTRLKIHGREFSGTRLKIHGREFRIIADTSVEAVVEDPRGITRAA